MGRAGFRLFYDQLYAEAEVAKQRPEAEPPPMLRMERGSGMESGNGRLFLCKLALMTGRASLFVERQLCVPIPAQNDHLIS